MPPAKHKLLSNKKNKKKTSTAVDLVQNRNPVPASKANVITPSIETAFKVLLSARFCSSIWPFISDCDETFNYWEPLHYLVNGQGLQTWEYSPEFALRSYTYLLIHGVPAWIYKTVFHPSPILIFYFVRCMLGLFCAIVEVFFYKGVCREFGVHIGRMWLIFQLFSAGMFISSTALLPSSFSMYLSTAALAAWWHRRYKLSIFFTAISTFMGWPFAGLIGVPIAWDILFRQNKYRLFFIWSGISTLTILLPMIVIDSMYFGKLVIAPINLVIYNVFTSHGPDLYGIEPISYYFINGFLNFNFIWALSLLTPILLILGYFFVPSKSKSTLNLPHYVSLAPLFLWLLVFILQPHKEERFLFPIYPMISLCGAISVDIIQKLYFRIVTRNKKIDNGLHYLDSTLPIAVGFLLLTVLLGLSRIFSLYRNYHAPIDLMMGLSDDIKTNEKILNQNSEMNINVCIGKDWYRYPNSFFLPNNSYKLRFLKSEFKGILPAYYASYDNATKIVHSYFNDLNQENNFMYFNYRECNYLIDLDLEKYTDLEPNYRERVKEWTVMKEVQFLNNEKSNRLLRSFYIPFLSDKFNNFCNFSLLKRIK